MSRNLSTRRFQLECLEARQLMAADLYIDFGAAFNWNANQGQHTFQANMLTDNRVNAPTTVDGFAVPTQLTSLLDGMVSRDIDYDQNGVVNSIDAEALAQEVAEMVSRLYEPFAVNVKIVGSANMNQVIDKLDDHSTNDAYVLVAGRMQDPDPTDEDKPPLGGARVDIGNDDDNVAFAWVENLLDTAANLVNTGEHPWTYVVSALARTIAHEAGHTFGLEHLLPKEPGEEGNGDQAVLTEDQALMAASDLMYTGDSGRFQFMNLATRWDGLPTEDGTQNAFDVLAANVGLKANGPAYVTGTGAHDTILIEGIGNNLALVTVSAFRDSSHTDLIETQSYEINTANGILVEGGRRNDRIEVLNVSVPVTLRGGSGHDDLFGNSGNDVFEGDSGDDDLLGAAGSDTYLFRGPRYQDLGLDDIDDSSGADDVLDFSALDYAVNVDLASTSDQQIEYERVPVTTSMMVNGTLHEFTVFVLPFGESRLDLDLKSGSGSTGIENVRGSRFNDRIYGNELDNELFGNAGIDWLYGYDGLDALYGGLHDDILRGGDKRDLLYGQGGRDQLFGELGDDYLEGGYDGFADVLNGGEGADEFVQYVKTVLTTGTFPNPAVVQTTQLVEGESLADFSSTKDKKVKKIVFPGFYTPFA